MPDNDPVEALLAQKMCRARRGQNAFRLALRLFATALAATLLLGVLGGISLIRGSSMEPALRDGDVAILCRFGRPSVGDIVILRGSGKERLVKRVIALAGDEVALAEDGVLWVNGQPEARGQTRAAQNGVDFPCRVPAGCLFLLGDNRSASLDSRRLGPIPQKQIIGRVIWVIGRR